MRKRVMKKKVGQYTVMYFSVFFSGYSGNTIFHNSSGFYGFSVSCLGSHGGRFSISTSSATC